MQNLHIPLFKIKSLLILKDRGLDIEPLVDLFEGIFEEKDDSPLTGDAYCKATGLSRDQLSRLVDLGVILPLEKDCFDKEDAAIGEIYAWALSVGFTLDDLKTQAQEAQHIVDINMRLSQRITSGLPYEEAAPIKKRLLKALREIRIYLVTRIFKKWVLQNPGSFTDERLKM
jgi:hypothetical protein